MRKARVLFGLLFAGSIVMTAISIAYAADNPPVDPLKKATVTEAKGSVEILENAEAKPVAASVGDVIQAKRILRTGKKSRAELEFKDASIARLGANTLFSFDHETRNIKLDRGSVLIQVFNPSGRCNIVTPAVTAAITGTAVIVETGEEGDTDVQILGTDAEDGVKITHNRTGKSTFIKPGQFASCAFREGGKRPRFEIKSFDVKQRWENHELGERMGRLRKMNELKHIREGSLLKDKWQSRKESDGDKGEGRYHESSDKLKDKQTESEKGSHDGKDEMHRREKRDKLQDEQTEPGKESDESRDEGRRHGPFDRLKDEEDKNQEREKRFSDDSKSDRDTDRMRRNRKGHRR